MNIMSFPREILLNIFRQLPLKDLLTSIPQTCNLFNSISKVDYLWQLICSIECNLTNKPMNKISKSWKTILLKTHCKHILSLDCTNLNNILTPNYKQILSRTTCSSNNCNINKNRRWICLECGYIGCSRYDNGHMMEHITKTNHWIFFNSRWDGFHYWCCCCNRYLEDDEHIKNLTRVITLKNVF